MTINISMMSQPDGVNIHNSLFPYQMIAITLEVLKKKAYEDACSDVSLDDWKASCSSKYVNFAYWETVQQFQITVLAFVRLVLRIILILI